MDNRPKDLPLKNPIPKPNYAPPNYIQEDVHILIKELEERIKRLEKRI